MRVNSPVRYTSPTYMQNIRLLKITDTVTMPKLHFSATQEGFKRKLTAIPSADAVGYLCRIKLQNNAEYGKYLFTGLVVYLFDLQT